MFQRVLKMVTPVKRKKSPFTFIWTIENVPKLIDTHLKSPFFTTNSTSKAKWCLRIKLSTFFQVSCWLQSEGVPQKAPSAGDIECSFLGADGTPLISKRNDKHDFLVFMLTKEVFLERYGEFSPNKTLTVQCQIWIKGFCPQREGLEFCFARTRLKAYSGSFLWPIEDFSALKSSALEDFSKLASDERKVYPLKPITQNGPFLALIMFLKRNYKSDDVQVNFLVDKGGDYKYGCEISVLGANGKVIVSQLKKCRTPFSWAYIKFYNLISKNKLISLQDLFLNKDTLLLRCSFEVYTGVISNEIEYCTPNVFAVVENEAEVLDKEMEEDIPLEFEQYFIKKADANYFADNCVEEKSDSDSCRDSCKLKAALRHLHSEAILSDVSLRIGTNLHPVHKNILGSRSPVFDTIFRKDVKKNIIEINDMEENTLCRLLQYIYTDTVGDLRFQNALDLFKAAADYQLLDLKDKCSDILIEYLSKTNVFDILSLAYKYQDEKLGIAIREFESDLDK